MMRLDCSRDGIHRPTVAGIHGNEEEECYSLALSGGYEDDLDLGECFTYTGEGELQINQCLLGEVHPALKKAKL